MSNVETGTTGAVAVGAYLNNNIGEGSLHTINLEYNEIGPEGGSAIGNALKSNTSLHTINLGDNDIGPQGGSAIGNALKSNTSLHRINLQYNEIGPDLMRGIQEAVRR